MQIPVQMRSQRIDAIVDIAIVVVEDVLAPIWRAAIIGTAVGEFVDLVRVIPVDVAVPPVEIGCRRDGDNDVVTDLLNVGLLGNG